MPDPTFQYFDGGVVLEWDNEVYLDRLIVNFYTGEVIHFGDSYWTDEFSTCQLNYKYDDGWEELRRKLLSYWGKQHDWDVVEF